MVRQIAHISYLTVVFLAAFTLSAQESSFRFLVISDVHISSDPVKDHKLKTLVTSINQGEMGRVDFLMLTGDNVACYFADRRERRTPAHNRAAKLVSLLSSLSLPYYLALGNHDYRIDKEADSDTNFTREQIDTMETLWKEDASLQPFYAFDHKGWKFVVLNSMRGRHLGRFFDDDQLAMLEAELLQGKPAMLFFHHPLQTDHPRIWCKPKDLITPKREARFYDLLQKHKKTIKGIFVGHGHRWNDDLLFDSIRVYQTTTFGERAQNAGYFIEVNRSDLSFICTRFER